MQAHLLYWTQHWGVMDSNKLWATKLERRSPRKHFKWGLPSIDRPYQHNASQSNKHQNQQVTLAIRWLERIEPKVRLSVLLKGLSPCRNISSSSSLTIRFTNMRPTSLGCLAKTTSPICGFVCLKWWASMSKKAPDLNVGDMLSPLTTYLRRRPKAHRTSSLRSDKFNAI